MAPPRTSINEEYIKLLFEEFLREAGKNWSEGTLLKLEKNYPSLYLEFLNIERKLNDLWLRSRTGETSNEEIKEIFQEWKDIIKEIKKKLAGSNEQIRKDTTVHY